jgi:hypothetical protein
VASDPGAFEPDDRARPQPVNFKDLFLAQDAENEDANDLADALNVLHWEFPSHHFTAQDVADFINTHCPA